MNNEKFRKQVHVENNNKSSEQISFFTNSDERKTLREKNNNKRRCYFSFNILRRWLKNFFSHNKKQENFSFAIKCNNNFLPITRPETENLNLFRANGIAQIFYSDFNNGIFPKPVPTSELYLKIS